MLSMEKGSMWPPRSPSSSSIDGSRELMCVGKLEIVCPKPVGFLIGSIPVTTDQSFRDFDSALIPSQQTVTAPRYRMLPTETDLNTPPLSPNIPAKVLPIGAVRSKTAGEIPWGNGAILSNLTRKCEALAVSGLVEYGDEIDVIGPADVLKQIFKMPYSKARLSIAVRRVGQTLVLNTGPDVQEEEKLVRRHKSQTSCEDQSLFLNFAMHSVRMEACDCPPTHPATSKVQTNSSVLPEGNPFQYVGKGNNLAQNEGFNKCSDYSQIKSDGFCWGSKKSKRTKSRDPVKMPSHVGEKPRSSMQDSDKHKRINNDEFLRVLFWQFHNFRMLLGSDLLLFSNEKYVAVSLHLWDVTRQVTPLTWLEAWLDNVMASVPELAICYHQNGVVQGYELLKTDEIFLLKGISEDGTPAFHPHVVQQNGLSVLRFLQDNCKQDPGAYWLYKGAGEDLIQLFDLSVIPNDHSPSDCEDDSSSVPLLLNGGRGDSKLSLGTLLYRVAHRLFLSLAPRNRVRCAEFLKKCLEFLGEQDHLVLRAIAHEQYARLMLTYDEEVDSAAEYLPIECRATVIDTEEECSDPFYSFSETVVRGNVFSIVAEDDDSEDGKDINDPLTEASVKISSRSNIFPSQKMIASDAAKSDPEGALLRSSGDESFSASKTSPEPAATVQVVADPISSKLAAIHHVSQAIKSLRWRRQLQYTEPEFVDQRGSIHDQPPSSVNFSVCACGDADCIEVCDIREWLPTSKLDHKLWKLVLLLGESYLALGEAYKEDKRLHKAIMVVELASTIYGSMPQHMEDTRFISSMNRCLTSSMKLKYRTRKASSYIRDLKEVKSSSNDDSLSFEESSSTYHFWARAWTLVGDVYVEFHILRGKEIAEGKLSSRELEMPSEVVKEFERLKRKLGRNTQNCSLCSLVNCSCQSDRANSGSSASSSTGETPSASYARKHNKKAHVKSIPYSLLEDPEDNHVCCKADNRKNFPSGNLQHISNAESVGETSDVSEDPVGSKSLAATNSEKVKCSLEVQNEESPQTEDGSTEKPKVKNGGIFKYLDGPFVGDAEYNLSSALNCYKEARKALGGLPTGSAELQAVIKKEGWVYNELGRIRLVNKELSEAELAFADAISAFRKVLDHPNIILINMNLGHGRRAVAEEAVTRIESLKVHAILQNSYKQALGTAKLEYCEALRYYAAAKSELDALTEDTESVPNDLRNEVPTQFAHTYLRLGMFLAREDTTSEVYENGSLENFSAPTDSKGRKELRKHEISANDAIIEALSVYESLGDLRKQEAAYAYFQLACYQRDSCLKFLELSHKKSKVSKGESGKFLRAKQYASLAERNWQKAIDFYGPETHSAMYLTILMEISALSFTLSSVLRSNVTLESALSCLLEARKIPQTISDSFINEYPDLHAKFWKQLQTLLKNMLAAICNSNTSKLSPNSQTTRSADPGKLRELYKISLKSIDLSQLETMHTLWVS